MSLYLTISQLLSFIPSIVGVLLRRTWYKLTLASCGKGLIIDWLAVIRTPKAKVGNNFYLGVNSFMAEAIVGDDVMISGHCLILSGGNHHGTKLGTPMRLQKGNPHPITLGDDIWIGVNCSIMADIATGSVVGSGSVVTRKYEENMFIVGVPAKPLKRRQ